MSQVGKYLNLHPHMQSWSVYNENGPYSKEHAIGALAPATFGGLSYRILGDKGGDIYIINTESFGRCAIWAPRDNDSSITASPVYSNGDTSGGSGGGENPDGNINPFGTKIFIDPGHGGSDPGASGHGLLEKDVVLSIAKKVGDQLVKKGYNVRYSRTTDKYVELTERARLANEWGASLFVSIHANAFNGSARGTECYTHPTEVSQTKKLSTYVASSISNSLGIPNRGHKEEDFSVLRNTKMPAILVETAFIDNASDAVLLKNNQDTFAHSIALGVMSYTESPIPDILEYSGKNGLFKGMNIKFLGMEVSTGVEVINVNPPVTLEAKTLLEARLGSGAKTIDLTVGPSALATALYNDLKEKNIDLTLTKEQLRESFSSLSTSTDISDNLSYTIEIKGNHCITTLEVSTEYNNIQIYQQLIIDVLIDIDDNKKKKCSIFILCPNETENTMEISEAVGVVFLAIGIIGLAVSPVDEVFYAAVGAVKLITQALTYAKPFK